MVAWFAFGTRKFGPQVFHSKIRKFGPFLTFGGGGKVLAVARYWRRQGIGGGEVLAAARYWRQQSFVNIALESLYHFKLSLLVLSFANFSVAFVAWFEVFVSF